MRPELPLPQSSDRLTKPISQPADGGKIYLDEHSQLHNFLAANPNFGYADLLKEKIADVPKGIWVSSEWYTDYEGIVTQVKAEQSVPVFIVYNAIKRDLGGQSAGGAANLEEYFRWFDTFVSRTRSIEMIVILEPDALPNLPEMRADDQAVRVQMIAGALERLRQNKKATVYLDIGHPHWLSVEEAAGILLQFNVTQFDGFSLNVSNRQPTQECLEYGEAISRMVNGKHFVIDTSRNAIPQDDWCNPSLEGGGEKPTFITGSSLCDAYLWLKSPGESDGRCNGGPAAGVLWIDRAIMLAQNAKSS